MYTRPSLQNFYEVAKQRGFGKKYNFQVEDITNIPALNEIPEYKLFVQSLTVPSLNVNTTTVPFKAFDFVVPTNVSFPENKSWSIEFISDDALLIRKLFEAWTKSLYNPINNSSTQDAIDIAANKLILNVIHETTNNDATQYTLFGIFPTQLGPLNYNISDNGADVMKFRVTMAYQYFQTKNVKVETKNVKVDKFSSVIPQYLS